MRDALLYLLTAAAGWADVLSYVALGHVFTANMTGNLVLLGLAIGDAQTGGAARSAVALAGFAAGALLAAVLTREAGPGPWPRRVTIALAVEAAVLLAFAALWWAGGATEALIALAAVGMGIQSGTVRTLAVSGVTTTFVTGTLTSLMAGLAALQLTAGWPRHAAVLVALLAGAVVGVAVWSRWPGLAAAGPATLVGAVAVLAAARTVRP